MCDPRTSCVRKLGANFLFGWKILVKSFLGLTKVVIMKVHTVGHFYSWDTSIQGTENLAPEKMFIYIAFVFVNSILTGHLYSGERDSFSGSRKPVLTFFRGTP